MLYRAFFHKENAKKNNIGGCSNNWRTTLCLLGNFSFYHKFLSSANYFYNQELPSDCQTAYLKNRLRLIRVKTVYFR